MSIKPIVSKITIFPVNSLDGVSLEKGIISEGGCILHDREYAIVGASTNFINGKSNVLVHSLRSFVDFKKEIISFRHQDELMWHQFDLKNEKLTINSYLTEFFSAPAKLIQNKQGRFLDIPDISGLTILSTASLQSVSDWFEDLDLEETRRRFRATIEIDGVQSFWEDHLFSKEGVGVKFKIGSVSVIGISPRARCVVPTRNPATGEVIHAFPRTFARQRAALVPEWSNLGEYGHHYHLAVDCYLPPTEIDKTIHVGDEIKIISEIQLPIRY